MVGNDIVDLYDSDAHPSTLNGRFDERVFCASERQTLENAPERRWKLWAAKEAAYKVAVKQDPATIFSPSRFRVGLEAKEETGFVTWDTGRLRIHVCVDEGAVHAIAATNSNPLISGLRRLESLPPGRSGEALSEAARGLAAEGLVAALGVDEGAIEIRKRGRVPELFVDGVRAQVDLSLSHHGEVVGFACEIIGAGANEIGESLPTAEGVT